MQVFGIDLSTWQKNYPYAKATQDGVKFAIIRAGFWTTTDNQFETHYKNAKKQGWGVGAYWYSYATTVAEAQMEAKAFLKVIKGKQFEYPLYIDIEDKTLSSLSKTQLDNNIKAFGKIIEDAGYYFGVYTSSSWYSSKMNGKTLNKKYDWWVAQWSTAKPTGITYGMWQFGGSTNYIRGNKVAGVVTDQNYAYYDYPSIMKEKGLNGYAKEQPVIKTPEPVIEKPEPVITEPDPVIEKPVEQEAIKEDGLIMALIKAIIHLIFKK